MVEKSDDVEVRLAGSVPSLPMQGDGGLAAIRQNIERTEAEMARTLDAIQEKMSFEYLRAQAQEKLLDAMEGRAREMANSAGRMTEEVGHYVAETIKEYPLPATLFGVGLGWLMMGILSGSTKKETRPVGRYDIEEGEGPPEDLYQAGLEEPEVGDYARGGKFYDYHSKVQSTAGKFREAAGSAQSKTEQIAGQAVEKARDLTGRVRDRAQQTGGKVMEFIGDNMVILGMGAAALGIAAGFFLPKTRREEKLIGGARETIVDKTREFGRQTMEKAERVVERAADAALEEAGREHPVNPKGEASAQESERSSAKET